MKQVVLLLAALGAAPAFAHDFYVTTVFSHAQHTLAAGGESLSDNANGLGAAIGYRITPNFAVELGHASAGDARVTDGSYTIWSGTRSQYVAAVGTWPVSPKVSLSARLGVAHNRVLLGATDGFGGAETKENKNGAMAGVGAAYSLTPRWALVAEYTHFGKVLELDGFTVKASMVSVGGRFSF
ncbi:MAG TPA: porin family protein [Telluria sp.]|nr:porin family protein [Telluria sp.]